MSKKPVLFLGLFLSTFFYNTAKAQKEIQYKESQEDILNPERGFYYPFLTNAANYSPLTAQQLAQYKTEYIPFKNAPFKVRSSLILRIFVLDGYQQKPLSDALLQQIDHDFAMIRQAGMKSIIRFAYNYTLNPNFAPPYKDAPLNIVKQHLQQLTPVLKKNRDVIAIAQQGFIGLWGETYYTDYYGIPGATSRQNLRDRAGVLDAYLKALPAPLIVQVRYPTVKQDYLVFFKKPAMASRIGFHNDAFLSSDDDLGTYKSFDITENAKRRNTKDVLMSYMQQETSNTAMGGESASANPPYDNCSAQGGQAEKQMARFHFSYLNSNYNPAVLSGWASCIDDIKRKLGYRFVLQRGIYPSAPVMANDTFSVRLDLMNSGYASPFNTKKVTFLLKNTATGKIYTALLPFNVKTWVPGAHTLTTTLFVPAQASEGAYQLLLKIADSAPALQNQPSYCIQLANAGTWKPQDGTNDLLYTVQIKGKRSSNVNTNAIKNLVRLQVN